ncbi:MAG TPA: porphobilinogen synthase [Candidatus Poseidoniaceae archaeon]|nr:MAG: porphobilinogen synthase [Euryarchaeota archaeon TMED141]DAC09967.1 MAG TPA: porphobilinogen synthase [Candidatus Poseidoniales archaeon]DAC17515.1 MAG TPA: porphobilinogen synthase [Candidatus Poseidoniales archaeon]HII18644.1 porphobilinogen synthase [Candidatus Poseidoniaceae archaeon]HII96782.1 porphobilinogen synthase [Candidatus Poseidoniaceae archaeon]
MDVRMRINRWTEGRRELLYGQRMASGLVQPHFVVEGDGVDEAIPSLPGIHRQSVDVLRERVAKDVAMGLKGHMLFPVHAQSEKDAAGTLGLNDDGPMMRALRALREDHGDAVVLMADVCMCTVTDHGHCGHVHEGTIANDRTVSTLAKMAVVAAEAGADYVGASDMMDGRVGAIRKALEDAGHHQTGVLSYAVKFASAFYGPFRDAAGSSPQEGDRRSHQMDPRSPVREAVMEAKMDEDEGADVLMVKPALAYLDVVAAVRGATHRPLAVYNVSGEYAMVHAQHPELSERRRVVEELMHAFRRAGADLVVTYHAREILAEGWMEAEA